MTRTLTELATALRAASAEVAEIRSRIPAADPGAGAFAVGAPGRLGTLADQLQGVWSGALQARLAEADRLVVALDANAFVVDQAAAGYRAVEDQNERRWAGRA